MTYWGAAMEAFKKNEPLPNAVQYCLNLQERSIACSLSPNPDRKTLFAGLTFVHYSTNPHHKYSAMIRSAGNDFTLIIGVAFHTTFYSCRIVLFQVENVSNTPKSIFLIIQKTMS